MKKYFVCFLALLTLIGCAVEDSPESQLDRALIAFEELETYNSTVLIKEGDTVLFDASYKDGKEKTVQTASINSLGESLASLAYCDIYGSFEIEESTVYCEINPENSEVLRDVAACFVDEAISSISQTTYLEDGMIDKVELLVKTANHTYQINIDIN